MSLNLDRPRPIVLVILDGHFRQHEDVPGIAGVGIFHEGVYEHHARVGNPAHDNFVERFIGDRMGTAGGDRFHPPVAESVLTFVT